MMNLKRFDPPGEMTLDTFEDGFFQGFSFCPIFRELDSRPQMRLELAEDDKSYTVKAEVPGVKFADIKVSIDGNQVSICAELKMVHEGDEQVRSERYYGRVSRKFTFGPNVDQEAVQTRYVDGILELVLPKKASVS